jgi:hypothetical protein
MNKINARLMLALGFLVYMRTSTGGTVYDNWEIGRQLPAGSPA